MNIEKIFYKLPLKKAMEAFYFLPKYIKYLAFLFILFIFSMALILLWIMPLHNKILEKQEALNNEKVIFEIRNKKYNQIKKFKINTIHIKKNIEKNIAFFAVHQNFAEIMKKLDDSLRLCKLRLLTVRPGLQSVQYGLHQQILTLTLSGDDQQLIHWLWMSAHESWWWELNQCKIQKIDQNIHILLKLNIYHE